MSLRSCNKLNQYFRRIILDDLNLILCNTFKSCIFGCFPNTFIARILQEIKIYLIFFRFLSFLSFAFFFLLREEFNYNLLIYAWLVDPRGVVWARVKRSCIAGLVQTFLSIGAHNTGTISINNNNNNNLDGQKKSSAIFRKNKNW